MYSRNALAIDSRTVAVEAGTLLNCTTGNMFLLIDCLRHKPASELLRVQSDAADGLNEAETMFMSRLGPVMDDDLISGNPTDLLKDTHSE